MTRVAIVAALAVLLGSGLPARAAPPPPPRGTICILFEDDSYECGSRAPGGYLDRTRPYVVGCIPSGICDSPDGMFGDEFDRVHSETVYPRP